MNSKLLIIIPLATLLFGFNSVAQSDSKVPIPEYFGVYAVAEGKLLGPLGKPKSSAGQSEVNVDIFSLNTQSAKKVSSLKLSTSDVKFIVFDGAANDAIKELMLFRLPYVRNLVSKNADEPLARALSFGNQKQNPPAKKTKPINACACVRISEMEVQLLGKPVPNQPQMIQLVPQRELTPGVYVMASLNPRSGGWFESFVIKSTDRSDDIIDITLESGGFGGLIGMHDYFLMHGPPEFPELTKELYTKVVPSRGSTVGTVGSNVPSEIQTYEGYMASGRAAFRDHSYEVASALFAKATALAPNRPDAWHWNGLASLANGQYQQATVNWDKALAMGGELDFPVAREGFLALTHGRFRLSTNAISFIDSFNKTVFSVHPSEIQPLGVDEHTTGPNAFFKIRHAGSKPSKKSGIVGRLRGNDNFDFVPYGVAATQAGSWLESPEPGVNQMRVVAKYVIDTIPKLTAGTFAREETGEQK